MASDTQIIEIIGRNRLINELLAAGFEVAQPIRDRGIDLIAYLDVDDAINHFAAVPIQLKVARDAYFTVNRKYDKFPNLIMAYVWGIDEGGNEGVTYALTQPEAVHIADQMNWTSTDSWITGGLYTSTRPSRRVRDLLEPHRMSVEAWNRKLRGLSSLQQPG